MTGLLLFWRASAASLNVLSCANFNEFLVALRAGVFAVALQQLAQKGDTLLHLQDGVRPLWYFLHSFLVLGIKWQELSVINIIWIFKFNFYIKKKQKILAICNMWIYKSWKFTDEPAGGPTYCAHMLNQCDDTPPGPFPLLGCLLLLNLRGWCCSTNETASIKTQQDKVGRGKESGRELRKTSHPQWFWQEVHFKETWWVRGVFQESDTRLMPRLSILRKREKNTSSLSLHTLDFSSSSKMALDALGGGGGGLSLGRTGSCTTIPARSEGHIFPFYYTSFWYIISILCIYTVFVLVHSRCINSDAKQIRMKTTMWIWHQSETSHHQKKKLN